MKRSFNKLLSLILVLATMVSMLAVFGTFASAEETAEEEEDKLSLQLRRDFGEGWDHANGFTATPKSNILEVDYETDVFFNYNYFFRYTQLNDQDGFLQYTSPVNNMDGIVVEFDVKVDEFCDVGRILMFRSKGGSGVGSGGNLVDIVDNQVYVLSSWNKTFAFDASNEWKHLAFVFDYPRYDAKSNTYPLICYFDTLDGDGNEVLQSVEVWVDGGKSSPLLDILRFGAPSKLSDEHFGESFLIDNLTIYSGVNKITEIPESMGYGEMVNENYSKTVTILGSNDMEKSFNQYVEDGFVMKVGVPYALSSNTRVPILTAEDGTVYGAPVKNEKGQVMVPLIPILEYLKYPVYVHPDGKSIDFSGGAEASYITIGKTTATAGGKRYELSCAPAGATDEKGNQYLVVAIDDIEALLPGWYVTYDDMGLIVLAEKDELINRRDHLSYMMEIMKKFIFDFKSADEIYEEVKTGTDNFTHPYLYVEGQETFDTLYKVYAGEIDDPVYYDMIRRYVEGTEKTYKSYSKSNGTASDGTEIFTEYVGMKPEKVPRQPHMGYDYMQPDPENPSKEIFVENPPYDPKLDNNGYDPDGGRCSTTDGLNDAMKFAMVYQITRDDKYALLAYDILIAMGEWTH